MLASCTKVKNMQKAILRHVWQDDKDLTYIQDKTDGTLGIEGARQSSDSHYCPQSHRT